MGQYFKEIGIAFWSTLKGLWVTLRYLVKPSITIRYPTEKLAPYEKFRGVLLYNMETCIACGMCVRACPSDCISLANAVNEQGKRVPKAAWYMIRLGKCNFCRLCFETCPTKPKSVWHSLDYELVFERRDEMTRCWRKEDDLLGVWFDPRDKKFKKPRSHGLEPEKLKSGAAI